MSSEQIECFSLGAPYCRVKVLGSMNERVKSACKKTLKPHSIGDVAELKDIREDSRGRLSVKVEFNPNEQASLVIQRNDRFFCESCQIPNDPMACEHMIWLVEKIARFRFQETYRTTNEIPGTLTITEDAKAAIWVEHELPVDGTYHTLRSRRSAFFRHVQRELELQRVVVTLDPHPVDGDRSTSQIWSALSRFLVQLPLEEPIPREDFVRMHFDKVRRWLKNKIDSGRFEDMVEDLITLDSQMTKNLVRATREDYISRDIINDAAEIFVLVLAILNIEASGAQLWTQCTNQSPDFFLSTMEYIHSGQTLQRETLAKLRQGLERALMTWQGYLPAKHWAIFQRFLG